MKHWFFCGKTRTTLKSECGVVAIIVVVVVLAGLCVLSFWTHRNMERQDSQPLGAAETIPEPQEKGD